MLQDISCSSKLITVVANNESKHVICSEFEKALKMFYKMLTISSVLTWFSANAQKDPRLYINGDIKTLPYIQLYLGTDENYQLKIFAKDTLKWQGYNGVYKIKGDNLYLSYHQLYAEPVCQ